MFGCASGFGMSLGDKLREVHRVKGDVPRNRKDPPLFFLIYGRWVLPVLSPSLLSPLSFSQLVSFGSYLKPETAPPQDLILIPNCCVRRTSSNFPTYFGGGGVLNRIFFKLQAFLAF